MKTALAEQNAPVPAETNAPAAANAAGREIQTILEALRGLRFGSLEIVVQDSRIVQIERREKRRLV